MTIKVGDRLPETTFMTMGPDGAPKPAKTAEVFGGKKVALFAVPGAYTPTCHKQHMAGFVQNYDELKKKVRRGRLHGRQRHLRADRLGQGLQGRRQDPYAGRRQRRVRQEGGPRGRSDRARPRRALQALFDGRRGRRRQVAQHRGAAGRGRRVRRRRHVQAAADRTVQAVRDCCGAALPSPLGGEGGLSRADEGAFTPLERSLPHQFGSNDL